MRSSKLVFSSDILNSPFYIAYIEFRKKMKFDKLSEEEWKKAFEIERPLTEICHPKDFE